MYTDPSGHVGVLTLIAKGSASAVADYLMQVTMNYYFNPDTQGNLKSSFKKVNGWQIGRSALEGLLPWKTPSGKFGRAALSAAGDVIVNALYSGKKYTEQQALIDYGAGFISDLAGGELGELVSKYGAKPVAKGLKMMKMSNSFIKKITGIDLSINTTPISKYSKYSNPVDDILEGASKSIDFTYDASKIGKQMGKRGWTDELIQDALDNPVNTVKTRDTRWLPGADGPLNDPATAYYLKDGGYVVRNDKTGVITQISNRNDQLDSTLGY